MIVRKITFVFLAGILSASAGLGFRHSYAQAPRLLKADGGLPMPPYPPGSDSAPVLKADGGLPMPPYPPGSDSAPVLKADGGLPMPPYPPGSDTVPNQAAA